MSFYWSGKTKQRSQTLSGGWFTGEDLYMLYKIKHTKNHYIYWLHMFTAEYEETGQKSVFM